MTSYDSDISGSSSASRLRKEIVGGVWGGYEEARASRIRRICLQGAAHGVWKEMTVRVVGGREEMCERKASSVAMSVMVDMMRIVAL